MYGLNRQRWKKVEYSRSRIIKAGKKIKNTNLTSEELEEETRVINNWRAAHAYPLHVIYMHLRRMADGKNIVVAERLKRLESIIDKLKREPSMSLWTMQDLGGCRFIVSSISEVYDYAEKYDSSRKRHIFKNKYDYINFPKPSGYRSLHMVYEYRSDSVDTYNKNMLIEIQYRTHLQHLWATAIETMDLFTKMAIKSGKGTDEIKRFFAIISSLFALKEKQPVVPGTSSSKTELIKELRQINDRYHFLDVLHAIHATAFTQENTKFKDRAYYILILNNNQHNLRILPFSPLQVERANKIYSQIEKEYKAPDYNTVLVRVESFQKLKSAYPNYFIDIGEFLSVVQKFIKEV